MDPRRDWLADAIFIGLSLSFIVLAFSAAMWLWVH